MVCLHVVDYSVDVHCMRSTNLSLCPYSYAVCIVCLFECRGGSLIEERACKYSARGWQQNYVCSKEAWSWRPDAHLNKNMIMTTVNKTNTKRSHAGRAPLFGADPTRHRCTMPCLIPLSHIHPLIPLSQADNDAAPQRNYSEHVCMYIIVTKFRRRWSGDRSVEAAPLRTEPNIIITSSRSSSSGSSSSST